MTATIYYRPVGPIKQTLDIWAPSAFITSMERAFGPLPQRLSAADIPTLRGMSSTAESLNNPYADIIAKIELYGEIEIWAES